jgi:hypothetical protein
MGSGTLPRRKLVMPVPSRPLLVLLALAACTTTTPTSPTKTEAKPELAKVEAKTEAKVEAKTEAKVEAKTVETKTEAKVDDVAPVEARDVEAPAASGPPVFHALARDGKLEVEILVDLFGEREQEVLTKLAVEEIGERTKLKVAPGDATLPKLMRFTELTVVDADGVGTAKVTEVAVSGGPSGTHGLLLLDRAAKKGAHALAFEGPAKNAKAKLIAISSAPVGKGDAVRAAVIAAAKKSITDVEVKWDRAKVTSLGGITKPHLGGLYLLGVEIPEGGGVFGMYGNAKDGSAVPLIDAQPEGILKPIGAVDLDGDGNDEILADLDAFEGAYVHLYRWNADTSKYESATIAGDGA